MSELQAANKDKFSLITTYLGLVLLGSYTEYLFTGNTPPFLLFMFLSLLVSVDGSMTYSEIRGFMKKQNSMVTMYKSVTTSSNKVIQLSGNHLIYGRKTSTGEFNPMYVITYNKI